MTVIHRQLSNRKRRDGQTLFVPPRSDGTLRTAADMKWVMAIDDATLWRAASNGDGEAFAELYERHADAIYRYLFRRLADWSEAEDLTAMVFLEAHRRRADVVIHDGLVLPWLYGIAVNVLRHRRRTLRRHRQALAKLGPPATTPDFAPDAITRVAAAQDARALLGEIKNLPPSQREVVTLCLWQGISYEEAAIALSVPVGTIRSRLSRAREALAQRAPTNRPEAEAMT